MIGIAVALLSVSTPWGGPPSESVFDRIASIAAGKGFSVWSAPSPPPTDLPFNIHAQFVDRQKRIELRIVGVQFSDSQAKETERRTMGHASGGQTPEGSLTGLRLGEDSRVSVGDRYWRLRVVVDRYVLLADMFVSSEAPTGVNTEERRAFARAFCERIARVLLADAMALDLDDEGRAQATATLTGCETNKQGFTTLARWAQERSVTVSYEENTASASFTRNGKSVKLYLASDRAVVNGQEVTLGGKFVMARGSRWFVPSAELDAATR